MSEQNELTSSKQICTGLLAHVDAGKTTLAEGILYLTGRIRSLGRVDYQDAFFDNFEMERARGITIFSKQAQVEIKARADLSDNGTLSVTLLDTPGHVDFSAEMERTLQVLDYAILVISGSDGVQSHVETLWRLLARYEIPVFLFVNKMDQPGTDREALLAGLQAKLDPHCVDFNQPLETEAFQEALAMCDDDLLEAYLSGEAAGAEEIQKLIAARKVFPCYFGSALKLQGVEELLEGLRLYAVPKAYPAEFAARVYKISRDAKGNRLTHMKITGGTLRVKDVLTNRRSEEGEASVLQGAPGTDSGPKAAAGVQPGEVRKLAEGSVQSGEVRKLAEGSVQSGEVRKLAEGSVQTGAVKSLAVGSPREIWEEKVNQIRILSGPGYETVSEAQAGTVCAVTGLTRTYVGEGLGIEPEAGLPVLEPVLSYQIELPDGTDVYRAFCQLKQLEEEEPQLHITWTPSSGGGAEEEADAAGEIHAQLMGEVQTEILRDLIRERYGLAVRFGEGSIVYRETIAAPVVGMGHFEPLRHYAEVHLLMEPLERGSGLQFESACSVDDLSLNWQRLVLTHLEEKSHLGVLTGSEITDMKLTLIAGRAHQKHTEGGDFRQATYRAVRQGLCRAKSILLEPVYRFRMELPAEAVGRALSDIQRMYGTADAPVFANSQTDMVADMTVITGTAPVVTMRGYQSELFAYTKGRGRLSCRLKGYEECHNAQEVIEARAYDAQADLENPCGSVFCAHGAGFVVNWEDVPDYVHIGQTDAYAEGIGSMSADAGACVTVGEADGAGIGVLGSEEDGISGNGAGMLAFSGRTNTGNAAGESALGEASRSMAGKSGAGGVTRGYPTGKTSASRAEQIDDDELRAIFERTYGPSGRDRELSRSASGQNGSGRKLRSQSGSAWAGYEASQVTRTSKGETSGADAAGSTGSVGSGTNASNPLNASNTGTAGSGGSGKRRSRSGNTAAVDSALTECLLVDGYNIIFAWDELKELAKTNLESARGRLLDLMSNYQGYKHNNLIVVFDAYRVTGHNTEVSKYHNIYVVYTKEAETADQYIEKTVRQINHRQYRVTVATSDALEQVIILGAGASRLSAQGLFDELELMRKDLRENYLSRPQKGRKAYLLDGREDMKELLPEDE